ncbi:hypothetical protein BKA62DRAFT_85284 [Auriculariales sp. MPI-PUGE-AT-0066]|nr:hypothetical protein BKA62DRAFT_85284 [Auriculariales sp. MPI-PUGE-AT-0066]
MRRCAGAGVARNSGLTAGFMVLASRCAGLDDAPRVISLFTTLCLVASTSFFTRPIFYGVYPFPYAPGYSASLPFFLAHLNPDLVDSYSFRLHLNALSVFLASALVPAPHPGHIFYLTSLDIATYCLSIFGVCLCFFR